MRFGHQQEAELDDIDLRILDLLQENCRTAARRSASRSGCRAPSVIERIKKLEDGGVITGYRAVLDARRSAWTSPPSSASSTSHPTRSARFERQIARSTTCSSATT